MSAFGRSTRDRPLLLFFVLAYAVSWAFWYPAVLASFGPPLFAFSPGLSNLGLVGTDRASVPPTRNLFHE
jgi:hypothetical protein